MRHSAPVVLAFLAVTASACMAPQAVRRSATYTIAPSDREPAFGRALTAMQSRGWFIAVSDRAAGLLTTQVMNAGAKVCGILTCQTRRILQISIAADGAVIVNLHEELSVTGFDGVPSGWAPNTAPAAVAMVEQEQAAILSEIAGVTIRPAPPAHLR